MEPTSLFGSIPRPAAKIVGGLSQSHTKLTQYKGGLNFFSQILIHSLLALLAGGLMTSVETAKIWCALGVYNEVYLVKEQTFVGAKHILSRVWCK